MSEFTSKEVEDFESLIRTSSESNDKLNAFVESHGKDKCDAMHTAIFDKNNKSQTVNQNDIDLIDGAISELNKMITTANTNLNDRWSGDVEMGKAVAALLKELEQVMVVDAPSNVFNITIPKGYNEPIGVIAPNREYGWYRKFEKNSKKRNFKKAT